MSVMKNKSLWDKLQSFQFDDLEAGFSFSHRLARENNWTSSFTQKVIEEYRRFLYLCCEAGHPVTPSEEVDQAWHLHLCYTRSYWHDLCRDTLKKEIHHGPTKGGKAEHHKFTNWYERTLTSYQREFSTSPPSEIWPPAEQRFAKISTQKIDSEKHFIIKKRTIYGAAAIFALSSILTSCGDGGDGLFLFFGIIVVIVIAISVLSSGGGGGKGGRGSGGSGCSSGCGDSGCSSGGGGCGGD